MKEVNDLIKVWNDGNLQLGRIKEKHKHPRLIHYSVIRTIIAGKDFDRFRHEEISSMNNVVKFYGNLDLQQHRDLFPEDWI